MDEEIKELPSTRKWRKYIKWGADDFLELAWHFTYIDQVLISFSSFWLPFLPPHKLSPISPKPFFTCHHFFSTLFTLHDAPSLFHRILSYLIFHSHLLSACHIVSTLHLHMLISELYLTDLYFRVYLLRPGLFHTISLYCFQSVSFVGTQLHDSL